MSALRKIYLVHHSHTDIGFTHPQPTVRYLQQRFLDEALDGIDRTQDYPEAARFRWTCETMLPVFDWLKNASRKSVDRFLAAEKRGDIEVTGCWSVLTQNTQAAGWEFMARKAAFLRSEFGLTIRSAMLSDINGVPGNLPDMLRQMGIGNFSMAINEHFGKSAVPRPRAYSWTGPAGGTVRLWNGLHYNANQFFGIPYNVDDAIAGIGRLETWLRGNAFDRDFLLFQVTRPDFNDNGGPDFRLPDFVRDWNARGLLPAMEVVTLSGFFDAVGEPGFAGAGQLAGEWTDFWNFGSTSTPYETALARRCYPLLRDVESILPRIDPAEAGRISGMAEAALEQTLLFDEHTWGGDKGISAPFNEASRSGLALKKAMAFEAEALCKMAKAEALEALKQESVSGESGPGLLIVNTLPRERTAPVRIPVEWLRLDVSPTISHQHRMQYLPVEFPDLGVPLPEFPVPPEFRDAAEVALDIRVPASGHVRLGAEEVFSRGQPRFAPETVPGHSVESAGYAVHLDPQTGGLRSIIDKKSGRELVAPSSPFPFGVPVREQPVGGTRAEIHPVPDWTKFMGYRGWSTEWKAIRSPMKPKGGAFKSTDGSHHVLSQEFTSQHADGGRLQVHLDDSSPFVELRVIVHFQWDEIPSAWYFPMEFDLSSPSFDYDSCGTPVRLGRDQFSGANMDYQTVHRWVQVSDERRSVVVVSRDTPIVSMGGFFFGRMTDRDTPRRPLLAAWLQSNYWDTNYAPAAPGPFEARFFLAPQNAASAAHPADLADEVLHPLLLQPAFGSPLTRERKMEQRSLPQRS